MFVMPAMFDALAAVRYVLPVILAVNFSPVFAETVEPPRSIEKPSLQQWNMRSKLAYGDLHSGEPFLQNLQDSKMFAWPLVGDWIEPGKSIENAGAESDGSYAKGVLSLAGDGEPVRDKPREAGSGYSKQPETRAVKDDAEDIHPLIWIWVAINVASLF